MYLWVGTRKDGPQIYLAQSEKPVIFRHQQNSTNRRPTACDICTCRGCSFVQRCKVPLYSRIVFAAKPRFCISSIIRRIALIKHQGIRTHSPPARTPYPNLLHKMRRRKSENRAQPLLHHPSIRIAKLRSTAVGDETAANCSIFFVTADASACGTDASSELGFRALGVHGLSAQ